MVREGFAVIGIPHLASIYIDYIQFRSSSCGHPYILAGLILSEALFKFPMSELGNGTSFILTSLETFTGI